MDVTVSFGAGTSLGWKVFVELGIAILTGLAIPIVLYLGQKSYSSLTNTSELLKEFNGLEMSRARRAAWEIVQKDPAKTYSDIAVGELAPQESLYVIMRFYHRLNAMREAGMLSKGRLLRLFGPVFAYWWKLSFEPQLVCSEWRVKEDIVALHTFFAARAKRERRVEDWMKWLADGEADRAVWLNQKVAPAPTSSDPPNAGSPT